MAALHDESLNPEEACIRSVLVVDDDEVTRIYLEHALEPYGYEVTLADSFDAVKAAMQEKRYALVLMDLVFADCSYDGFDILDYVRSLNHGSGIIIMTSYPGTDSAVQALRIKAADYLTKPVKQKDLIETVQRVLSETPPIEEAELDDEVPGDYRSLSTREMDVLKMLYKGYSYSEIAEMLGCASASARTYGKRVYKKLGVKSRSEAVYEALQLKLI